MEAQERDVGDFVLVTNVERLVYTGTKASTKPSEARKKSYRHSGYIGNLKITYLYDLIRKDPCEPLRRAISSRNSVSGIALSAKAT